MKNVYTAAMFFLVVSALLSCNQPAASNNNNPPSNGSAKIADKKVINSIPVWIIDTLNKRNQGVYDEPRIEIEKFKRLNDSIFYIIYRSNTGVCSDQVLLAFKNNLPNDEVVISHSPDHDQSSPEFNYSEFSIIADDDYQITSYTQQSKYPKKVLTEEGHFKEGYHFENVELTLDSIVTRIKINPDSRIMRDTIKRSVMDR